MNAPVITNKHGVPFTSRQIARIRADAHYEAASIDHPHTANWFPAHVSAQTALSADRELSISRIHEMARNDGWAAAGITRTVDIVIGGGWRLSAKPNLRTLGLSVDQGSELANAIEAEWFDYVRDPGLWCDLQRQKPMGGILALGFRHRFMDGEALAGIYWKPRGGKYATAISIIDPDRLSQPFENLPTDRLRDGIEMDADGAAIAYHIRKQHPGDDLLLGASLHTWERVARETRWGRPKIVHAFEADRAGQVRGASKFAPILRKLKQVTKYDDYEMQAAALNAVMAAFIESPYDLSTLSAEIGAADLEDYEDARRTHYKEKPLRMPGVQLGFLYTGEKANLTAPTHPNAVFEAFMRVALRNIASAFGLSYEQLTMDWSQVNYSSARAALLEVWRGLTARKENFAMQFMAPIYMAWLEEAIDKGFVRLPARAPDFRDARAAYCHAEWIGPPRGWVDPQKEADASATRLDAGLSTLERECAEQGLDWQDVAVQRARERKRLAELGLNPDQPLRNTVSRDNQKDDEE